MLQDYTPIRADYSFFEEHSTEAEEDVRAYLPHLASLRHSGQPVRMLDFGCGEGRFTNLLLSALKLPRGRLQLSLVEPAESYRREAAERLSPFSAQPVRAWPSLPHGLDGGFDLALANHSLYYVPDLAEAVSAILRSLQPDGLFLCAMAGQENLLIQFWNHCFGLIDRSVPYHTAEDLESALKKQGVAYSAEKVPYELAFPDSEQNRLHILRFLVGAHFSEMPRAEMLAVFDPHRVAGIIRMHIVHRHFVVWKNRKPRKTSQ